MLGGCLNGCGCYVIVISLLTLPTSLPFSVVFLSFFTFELLGKWEIYTLRVAEMAEVEVKVFKLPSTQ